MPMERKYDPRLLAGGFPCGLNTASPVTDLQPDETPAGYGYDITLDGVLTKGSIPSGTSRIQSVVTITDDGEANAWAEDTAYTVGVIATEESSTRIQRCIVAHTSTFTVWVELHAYVVGEMVTNSGKRYICAEAHTSTADIDGGFIIDYNAGKWNNYWSTNWERNSVPYYWHYNRLWNITGRVPSGTATYLRFGAVKYKDVFVPQRDGRWDFDEDSEVIVALLPVQPDSLIIAKASGSYFMRNLSDTRAFFQRSDIVQSLRCDASDQIIEVGGVPMVTNSDGLIGYVEGGAAELSRKIRPDANDLSALSLTADFEKRWVILGTSHVYDMAAQKWFKWSGSNFLWTSRAYHTPLYDPWKADALTFVVEFTDTNNAWFDYDTKYENDVWRTQTRERVPFTQEEYTRHILHFNDGGKTCQRFQIRLTNMSSNIRIKEIYVNVDEKTVNAFRV